MTDTMCFHDGMRIRKSESDQWELLLDDAVQPSKVLSFLEHLEQSHVHTLRLCMEEKQVHSSWVMELSRDFLDAQSCAIAFAKNHPFMAACMAFHAGVLANRWYYDVEKAFNFPLLSTLPLRPSLLSDARTQLCFVFGYMSEERSLHSVHSRDSLYWKMLMKPKMRLEEQRLLAAVRLRLQQMAAQPTTRSTVKGLWESRRVRRAAIAAWRRWRPAAIGPTPSA